MHANEGWLSTIRPESLFSSFHFMLLALAVGVDVTAGFPTPSQGLLNTDFCLNLWNCHTFVVHSIAFFSGCTSICLSIGVS